MDKLKLNLFIEYSQQGSYLTIPFTVPAETETLKISYGYGRYAETQSGGFTQRREENVVDLALLAPGGRPAGASGSNKSEITLSEAYATPGYTRGRLEPGEWRILAGAYKIAPEGAAVTYEIECVPKRRRLLKGDLHAHTLASDGVLAAEELARHAQRNGLDFLAVTDHNVMSSAASLPQVPGITLIPGVEWTHFMGHANFLGVDRPYDGPFSAGTAEEARSIFLSGRERGALVTVNHPFEPGCEFRYDLGDLPFDCLEVWNGPMRESNLKALPLWNSLLMAGRKLPACGGSDYHRDTPFIFAGGPTTCVYAQSAGAGDILDAVRRGRSYITFAPDGPALELCAGGASPGDTAAWQDEKELEIKLDGLLPGDVVRTVTQKGETILFETPAAGSYQTDFRMGEPGFARVEVLRRFLPGLPALPALISNPVYFEG